MSKRKDMIDDALVEVQELCRTSWSENEIIERIEQIRILRKNEARHVAARLAALEEPLRVAPDERWGWT